jgi:hypothetical protein
MKNGQLSAGTYAGTAGTGSEQFDGPPSRFDALGYLQSVYNNPMEPTSVRMRAASVALEFERPRLAVTALVDGGDFAERLDRALERSASPTKVIEHAPARKVELPPMGPAPRPMSAPFAQLERHRRA